MHRAQTALTALAKGHILPRAEFGDLPEIAANYLASGPGPCACASGGEIIEPRLRYSPGCFWPVPGQEPPDPDTLLVLDRQSCVPMAEILSMFADGFACD